MYLLKFKHTEDFGHNLSIAFGGCRKFVLSHIQVIHSNFWRVPDVGFSVNLFDGSLIHLYFSFLGQTLTFDFFIYGYHYVKAINE
jgi:hypothetical protein